MALKFDTRTDPADPWSGWYASTDIEHGRGTITAYRAEVYDNPVTFAPGTKNEYTRGFLDVRRYNRLGPSAQLNMRAVIGGWLGGDVIDAAASGVSRLPGRARLPGFGFRVRASGSIVGTCNRVERELVVLRT